MRVRQSTTVPNRRPVIDHVASLAISAIMAFVGFVLTFPFIYVFFVQERHFHRMSMLPFLLLTGFIVGGGFFIAGIIGVLTADRSSPASSNVESDVSRIRFDIENNRYK